MTTPEEQLKEADWCETSDNFFICGTQMKEAWRKSEGIKFCFVCRKRTEFEFIVSIPDGLSYYGASFSVECSVCKTQNGDLFPGREREWIEA